MPVLPLVTAVSWLQLRVGARTRGPPVNLVPRLRRSRGSSPDADALLQRQRAHTGTAVGLTQCDSLGRSKEVRGALAVLGAPW
ncbi:hypothetical protein NDU88_005265 [Pleurodeles waltl]|uniref:Secreted protein n=1 Tax=Pleurodeles waltl TaxID=8319 RepID=A0AAV7UJ31_PLEWA|nr:hypothetical protein NDU88_005265 [Pleurodeles waltl]